MFIPSDHINNIKKNGFTIIRNAIDHNLIDNVIKDFNDWSSIPLNDFVKFKSDRVTNFHIYSQNTLDLVTNKYVNEILELLFNNKQSIYSSLFFREGTAQHFHRDTPHFYTNPIDQYFGVWYALEDININAGPLKYYIGSHELYDPNGYEIFSNINKNLTNNNDYDTRYECLLYYNKIIESLCEEKKLICVDEKNYINKINKGDIIIWHPRLLHGGSNIIDKNLTRYSMVTHNTPINTAVFNATHFFTNEPTNEYMENKFVFDYIVHNDISIVDHHCPPRVQKTYL